ncbi:unnamed protein product [Closterium sp. NIES-65]|nr:unnamed protein product [Closterium sp. NIES-65]
MGLLDTALSLLLSRPFPTTPNPSFSLSTLQGGDILNIGFGMGIIDTAIAARIGQSEGGIRSHTIVEAHPDVIARMKGEGWHEKEGVRVVEGRWQDVLPQLGQYDGIFFDTYGEYYDDLREFHSHLPRLLKPSGLYSLFNGMCGDNAFFHTVWSTATCIFFDTYGEYYDDLREFHSHLPRLLKPSGLYSFFNGMCGNNASFLAPLSPCPFRFLSLLFPAPFLHSGIFFDTYGEYYDDLQEFHSHLPSLLKPSGLYSFFNGMCGNNAFFLPLPFHAPPFSFPTYRHVATMPSSTPSGLLPHVLSGLAFLPLSVSPTLRAGIFFDTYGEYYDNLREFHSHLPSLLKPSGLYSFLNGMCIFFDTYGEYYDDLREFHSHLPQLLKPSGLYSFFNGMCGDNAFFHTVYCHIVALELQQLVELTTQFIPLPVSRCLDGATWAGVRHKYWQLDAYHLPVCYRDETEEGGEEEKEQQEGEEGEEA